MIKSKGAGVLAVARGHIGDLIQATPALRALRAHYPERHIAVLVNEYAAGVLNGCPHVDEVIPAFAYEKVGKAARLLNAARLIRTLRGRFDVVFCLWYSPAQLPAIACVSGIRTRVGFEIPGVRGRFLTHSAGVLPMDQPCRVASLMPLYRLGIEASPEYTPLTWAADRVGTRVDGLMTEAGVDAGPYAVLQVSCNWGCNELRSHKWAEIVDRLWVEHDLPSVVIGLGDRFERAKLDEIRRLTAHPPVSVLGTTTLPELFEVVRRSSLVVATDSALTQIALAQATPAVILFGIEPIVQNGPLPAETGLMEVIQHWDGPEHAPPPNPNCRFLSSYCHTELCRENSSLAQTTPLEVMERVAKVLAGRDAKR